MSSYSSRWTPEYLVRVSDGSGDNHEWSVYLRRMTSRPDWSVARLARDSGIHRATIFGWMREGGESVTIGSVRAIAEALGDSLENALRAAADLPPLGAEPERDPELELIFDARVPATMKKRMIEILFERREREREQRMADLRVLIDEAS